MSIAVRLIGFGDDRPGHFGNSNQTQVEVEGTTSVRELLRRVGIEDAPDLILMDASTVIPRAQWDAIEIEDQTTITVLSAIEGG